MKFINFLLIPAVIVSFAGCHENANVKENKTAFCLTELMQKKVTVETVKPQTVKNVIALSGKIEANEDKWVKVYPVVGGIVEEMKVQLGDYVKKGQELAVIRSSEIADFQSQLSYAQSNVKITEKNLSSVKEMFKSGLATEKDVLSAETDLEKAKSDLNRIRQTNAIYGSKGNAIQTITAPVSGYIVEKNVTDKMQYRVDAAAPFFIIANLDEVWVMANVFETDIAKIKEGYDADINVIAYKDKVFKGKVDRIFSMLDPQSKVMKVRVKIQNTDMLLKPEMFAQINIKYEESKVQLPAIPAKAVIFDKNKYYVIVYKDKCNLEIREIELFQTVGDTSYIKSGLSNGEKIISEYQLLVYDALKE
jgi:membrane fusion protein, heavy metal efflux system